MKTMFESVDLSANHVSDAGLEDLTQGYIASGYLR